MAWEKPLLLASWHISSKKQFIKSFWVQPIRFEQRQLISCKSGQIGLITDGWAEVSEVMAVDLAKRFANDGVSSIVYTDIARDGMMQGVNVEATAKLAEEGGIPVIASGGVTNMDDLKRLATVADKGVIGAIIGRAIYEGTLDVAEAQAYCDSLQN